MKKALLLMAAMMLSLGSFAQLSFDPAFSSKEIAKPSKATQAPMKAMSQGEVWIGYYPTGGTRSGLGTQTAETYDMCAYFPGTNAGKTIKQIRFYLRALTALKNVKVWVSTTLPASADDADIEVLNYSNSELAGGDDDSYGKENIATLTAPYTITSEGVYVGYSFTVKPLSQIVSAGGYPIVLSNSTKSENGLFLKTSSTVTTWQKAGTKYGDLALQLLVEGQFPENSVDVSDIADMFAALNGSAKAKVTLTNTGLSEVNDVSYTVKADGKVVYTGVHGFSSPISDYGLSKTMSIDIPAAATTGKQNITVTVDRVNDIENESTDPTGEGILNTVSKLFKHRPSVEEYTGTGCGYCPRGLLGMDNMRKAFGDDFCGIALHQYNSSDPMYIASSNYASVSFDGAPECTIERNGTTDPFYGDNYGSGSIVDQVSEVADEIAEVGVEVTGTWNADKTAVDATATVEAISDGNAYDIEYVLIADDLHSTDEAWNQHNYYYQYSASQVNNDPDMSRLCSGGDLGTEYLNDWHFNDVAIASSVNNAPSLGTLAAYSPVTSSYTVALPTSVSSSATSGPTMLEVLDKNQIYVLALVTRNGKVVNACKAHVTEATGINNIFNEENNAPVMQFSANGQRVNSNHHGLTIIRMADGTAKKIIK